MIQIRESSNFPETEILVDTASLICSLLAASKFLNPKFVKHYEMIRVHIVRGSGIITFDGRTQSRGGFFAKPWFR
jgi:hypothetical protein